MATDIALVIQNLLETYPFAGKTVLAVGAGDGQLVEYGRDSRRLIAVNRDAAGRKTSMSTPTGMRCRSAAGALPA